MATSSLASLPVPMAEATGNVSHEAVLISDGDACGAPTQAAYSDIRNAIQRQGFAPNHKRALLRLAATRVARLPACPKKATVLAQLKVCTVSLYQGSSTCFVPPSLAQRLSPLAAAMLQTPMSEQRKWGRRSKAELKLVWLVIEELYGDLLSSDATAPRPVHFSAEGATVSRLVSIGLSESQRPLRRHCKLLICGRCACIICAACHAHRVE